MRTFIIHPKLTIGENNLTAVNFCDTLISELQNYVDVTLLINDSVLSSTSLNKNDLVILFNRSGKDNDENVLQFLEEAIDNQVEIFPIAINRDSRQPADLIKNFQSYDVADQLRSRCLTESSIGTVAIAFARFVVACVQPTLSKKTMQLFISYRRLDGEDIAASLYLELRKQAEEVFRDIVDVKVGEDAQNVIEERLRSSDLVLFLDTPKSGESEWIVRELSIALGLNIPIVWVRLGDTSERVALELASKIKLLPADKPHLIFKDEKTIASDIANVTEQIMNTAFQVARLNAHRVFGQVKKVKRLSKAYNLTIQEKDKRHMLYELYLPRNQFRYPQKPMKHLVQFYGRWPRKNDCETTLRCQPGIDSEIDSYDAVILLGPIPTQDVRDKVIAIDSTEEYIREIERYYRAPKSKPTKRGIIISGAFADCEPEFQQNMKDAVHHFAQAAFDRSGVVIFGGHPTFQHIIFDLAKRCRPDDYVNSIHLYLSNFFVAETSIDEYTKYARTFLLDKSPISKPNREDSLTQMRQAMIQDEQAIALVAIGGKVAKDGHKPGIDEEIELAKKAGLPIFLIGSTGGRSAEIAVAMYAENTLTTLNPLTSEQNKELIFSTDYAVLADIVLSSVGL